MSARVIDDDSKSIRIERNPIARTGILQYTGRELGLSGREDELINVFRPPETLENPELLDSFKGKPILIGHQMLKAVVADDNSIDFYATEKDPEGLIHGSLGDNIEFDSTDGILYAPVNLYTGAAHNALDKGVKELSIGVYGRIEPKSGSYNGEKYEFTQIITSANHVALVESGRAGDDVAILDSNEKVTAMADMKKWYDELTDEQKEFAAKAIKDEEAEKAVEDEEPDGDEKKVEDEEPEKAVEDEEAEKKPVMDAAAVLKLIDKRNSDTAARAKNAKAIYEIAKEHVGDFAFKDSASDVDIARYALKKLGKPDNGNPVATLKGYHDGKKQTFQDAQPFTQPKPRKKVDIDYADLRRG